MALIPNDLRVAVQQSIFHGPGRCTSVLLFDRKQGVNEDSHVRRAAASLMASSSVAGLPSNVHILVALGARPLAGFGKERGGPVPDLPENHDSMTLLPSAGLVQESHDIFVQVAADTELDRMLALRLVDACLGETMSAVQELHGRRLLDGIEHFGFLDGAQPTLEQVAQVVDENREGRQVGQWLLFQPYGQNVRRFFADNDDEVSRARVLGRVPAVGAARDASRQQQLNAVEDKPPPTSHWVQMRRLSKPLLRRGFPCRSNGEPTLAFVALAARFEYFEEALRLFRGDDLHPYVTARGGAVYFCPPEAAWLDAEVPVLRPNEIAAVGSRANMNAYDVVMSFEKYIMALVGSGIFEGSFGDQRVVPEVRARLSEIHRFLDPNDERKLEAMLTQVEKDANTVNGPAGRYVTAS